MTLPTTVKVIDNLEESFSPHGLPLTIKSNNGPQFCAEEFQEYCRHWDHPYEDHTKMAAGKLGS